MDLFWLIAIRQVQWRRLQSLCGNSKLTRFCSARLQAGILKSSRCPPEGGRYMKQNRVLTQALQPVGFGHCKAENPQAEACAAWNPFSP
jgi:hypothetical protein